MRRTYEDRSPMGHVEKTPEGYYKFDAAASRSGIFLYPQPDGSVRRAYRAPEEVFKRESMDSFALKPIINNHEMGVTPKITPENVKAYQIGNVGENVRRDGNLLRLTGVIMDKTGIQAVDQGRRGLSLAYDSDDIEEPGQTADGQEYDYRQTNIRGNHLAIVDRGRAGDVARLNMDSATVQIMDCELEEGSSGDVISKNIAKLVHAGYEQEQAVAIAHKKAGKTKQDSIPTLSQKERMMKYNLDGVEVDAPESIVNAVVKARTDLATAQGTINTMKADAITAKSALDKVTAERDTANAEVTRLKGIDTNKLVADGVAARILLVESASQVCDAAGFKGKTDAEIRLMVIKQVFHEMNMDGKSADYVGATFDAAIKAGDNQQRKDALAEQRRKTITVDKGDPDNKDPKNPNAMLQDAWKQNCSLSTKKKAA
jgi:uncharacterized protein